MSNNQDLEEVLQSLPHWECPGHASTPDCITQAREAISKVILQEKIAELEKFDQCCNHATSHIANRVNTLKGTIEQ